MRSGSTELYLIRHGETEMNAAGLFYGWTDCEMSEKGIMQAAELADILQGVSFDAVIASSLSRAVATAVLVSGFTPDEIIKDDRLRELNFGAWEGLHHSEVSSRNKAEWDSWISDWINIAPPEGESFVKMYDRVKSCIDEILEHYRGKKVLVVSHQGTMRIIPMVLLGLTSEAYWSFTAEQGRYSHYGIDDKGHCIIRRINSGR